jgi:hypothetical protein
MRLRRRIPHAFQKAFSAPVRLLSDRMTFTTENIAEVLWTDWIQAGHLSLGRV